MRIANKITLLIVFLLCVMGANTWVGLSQMNHIRGAFAAMADYDVVLMESVTNVHELQLKKTVLLQQLVGIAEELGFEHLTFARSSYLHDQLKNIHAALGQHMQQGSEEITKGRSAAAGASHMASGDQRAKLTVMLGGLHQLESALKNYYASIEKLLGSVEAGGFQLSLEDLQNMQRQENTLSKDSKDLLKQVQDFSRDSLARTGQWEKQAQKTLMLSLWLSVTIGIILTLWIVRSIVRPLDQLSRATRQIGQGDFKIRLNASSKDEVAQLAQAFNTMSAQLDEFKTRLENQNTDLKETNAELDRFIRILGEDIANPLMMMVGYCAYLEQHAAAGMDPKSQEALQGLRRSTVRMHEMVKQLLEFNKAKRRQIPA